MSTSSPRSIHTLAVSLWSNPRLKSRFDVELRRSTEELDLVQPTYPVAHTAQICPARLHADFSRHLQGRPAAFPENQAALAAMQIALDRIGFIATGGPLQVASKKLRIVGELDAIGTLGGLMPCLLELKVVSFIPQWVRSSDAAQLMLYGEALAEGKPPSLMVLYVQPAAPFRAEVRGVFATHRLLPLVHELAA